jgi:AcrR family transcriptional regulator
VPRLWSETVEEHRRDVREAILTATWGLVREHGLLSVTMSQIAEAAGIGRATLYKYFPDVEAILRTYHQRHVQAHLEHLVALRSAGGDPWSRLEAFLEAFAGIARHRAQHGAPELSVLLHRGDEVAEAEQRVADLVRELLAEVAPTGRLRDDVPHAELAAYCVHALGAAGRLTSEGAVARLVAVTMAGLAAQVATKRRGSARQR